MILGPQRGCKNFILFTQELLGKFTQQPFSLCLSMLQGHTTLEVGVMSGDQFPSLLSNSEVLRFLQVHFIIPKLLSDSKIPECLRYLAVRVRHLVNVGIQLLNPNLNSCCFLVLENIVVNELLSYKCLTNEYSICCQLLTKQWHNIPLD